MEESALDRFPENISNETLSHHNASMGEEVRGFFNLILQKTNNVNYCVFKI